MKLLLRTIDELPPSVLGGAIAIGNFDGVHRGHRVLVEQLTELAKLVDGPAIVFTFDPPPAAILAPQHQPPALTWIERRAKILFRLGVDVVVACPTSIELLKLEPEEFFHQILIERMDGRAFVEGPNFRFGRNRRGDMHLLEQLCRENDRTFSVVLAQASQGEMISSSRIRDLISDGRIAQANSMLMEPYRIIGTVVQGAGRGKNLGFPTANLDVRRVLVPGQGVYAGRVNFENHSCAAAIHIGPNPTFGEAASKVEIHLLDFDQDLYGQELEVEVLERIRDIVRFGSVDQLKERLRLDLQQVRQTVPLDGSENPR